MEAYFGDPSRVRSFSLVVYVDDPNQIEGFGELTLASPIIMFLLKTTENVRSEPSRATKRTT